VASGHSQGRNDDCQIADSRENPAGRAGLAYREAFTTYAADDAVDYLVNAFGLHPDCDSAPRPGKIVFVYRAGKEAISHQLSAVSKGGAALSSH
jgi:hypothetical protein